MTEEITLARVCDIIPWGFRLTGGVDFSSPLTVSRITTNSIAEKQGLKVGDIITEIGNEKSVHLTHAEAQHRIIESKNTLRLVVLRGSCPDVTRALTPIRGLTPSSPIIIEKKQTLSTTSAGSVNSLFDDDSFEFLGHSDDDLIEEPHEPTEEQIDQMLLENAEVIEEKGKTALGVNFRRFIPKCDFIKDSAVFQILQEEQVHKEVTEKEQLQKCPTKRFSTFMLHPDRPIPPPKSKCEEKPAKGEICESPRPIQCMKKEANPVCGSRCSSQSPRPNSSQSPRPPSCQSPRPQSCKKEIEKNTTCNITCNRDNDCAGGNKVKLTIEKNECTTITEEEFPSESNTTAKSEGSQQSRAESTTMEILLSDSNDYTVEEIGDEIDKNFDPDKQLKEIKNTLSALGQLPLLIQSQLDTIQAQIDNLLKAQDDRTYNLENSTEENEIGRQDVDNDSRTEGQCESNQRPSSTELREEDRENKEIESCDESKNECQINENEPSNNTKDTTENNKIIEKTTNEDFEEQDFERRHAIPITPLPRPVVLPGGRIWRKPKDAFNEEFIAETLISQAEVLVGSTLGVNFRKYETPKPDYSNSEVYKLVHNLDKRKVGLEDRDIIPALQDYYQSPISARHFYCASLAEKARLAKISEH